MRRAWLLLSLLSCAPWAQAHESSLAYLTLEVAGARIEGRWDVAVRDLEDAVGLDSDGDEAITWAEFEARRAQTLDYARGRLQLSVAGTPCSFDLHNDALDLHAQSAYAVLRLSGQCDADATRIRIGYGLLFDIDATHRALLELSAGGRSTTAVLSYDRPVLVWAHEELSAMDSLREFVIEGVRHIWQGYDHLVFLGLLLFPAVLRRTGAGHAESPLVVISRIARIVTAFTLAHSLTLGLAVYGLIAVPGAAVEIVIAASIVVAGLSNLLPRMAAMGTGLAFGFGLVHGLGFANALRGLGSGVQLVSLAGFNAGVELGQLAVVVAALPVLFAARRVQRLRQPLLAGSSLACAALGALWLLQRLG